MKLNKILLFLICISFTACSGVQSQQKVVAMDPEKAGLSRLAKSDINEVTELHQRAVIRDLKELMLKLYKRNPVRRHDKSKRDIKASVDLFFSQPNDHYFPQWKQLSGTDVIRISLDESYQGKDRVLPFIFGLRKMLMASYDNHTEFFYFTSIDEQKLYNSARNIEIAAWMLAENKDLKGNLLLLSDSLADESRNLSYQRLFGKMIATQDNLAQIIASKKGRLIKTVVVNAATMMFLPI